MNQNIATIIAQIRQLESELELELARGRLDLAFTVKEGVVRFEERILKRHRQLKSNLAAYILRARPLMILSAPIIYILLVPFMLLDLFISLYQLTCFPVYGIPSVRRGDYIVFDRAHLAYLNLIEKINCSYCSYANGLIAYVREIASLTEQFWCPIKHARRVAATHTRYARFVDYGDAEQYHEELETLRKQLQKGNGETPTPL
ncbi:MAG: hypothetical protein WB646_12885 [Steroidobacteraceae bacterium]